MGLTRLDQVSGGPTWPAQVDGTAALVIIRPLPPAMSADPARRDALDAVVATSAGMSSPNVARFLGYDELEGLTWLVRENADGISLDRALATWGACGWAQAMPLIRQMAAGLAALHAQGLIHGRLQPSNVIISQGGQVRLVDYSLPPEMSGPALPRYQAPEGARDAGSDLYSLGVIAYELLTGDREGLEPARLPADAAPGVAWLLRQSPAQPPRSADEVISALDGYLTVPDPGPAGGAPPAYAAPWRAAYSPPPVGQSRARSGSAIAIVVGLVLAAVVGLAVLGRSPSGVYVDELPDVDPIGAEGVLAELKDPGFQFSGDVTVSVMTLGNEPLDATWEGRGTAAGTRESSTITVSQTKSPGSTYHGWTTTVAGQSIYVRLEGQAWSVRDRKPGAADTFAHLFESTQGLMGMGQADGWEEGLIEYWCWGFSEDPSEQVLDAALLGPPDAAFGEYFVQLSVIVAPESPRVRGMSIEAFWLDSTGDTARSYQMTMDITFAPDRPVKIEAPDLSSASPSQPTPAPSPTPSPTAGPSPSPVALTTPGQGRRLGRRPARGACG